jgi:hypothetical protein
MLKIITLLVAAPATERFVEAQTAPPAGPAVSAGSAEPPQAKEGAIPSPSPVDGGAAAAGVNAPQLSRPGVALPDTRQADGAGPRDRGPLAPSAEARSVQGPPVPEPPRGDDGTGMMVAGIVMTSVGLTWGAMGGIMAGVGAGLNAQCTANNDCEMEPAIMVTGIVELVIGGVFLAAGIPSWAVGAHKGETAAEAARMDPARGLEPTVRIGPGSAGASWQF